MERIDVFLRSRREDFLDQVARRNGVRLRELQDWLEANGVEVQRCACGGSHGLGREQHPCPGWKLAFPD